jgi:hypothetical protein
MYLSINDVGVNGMDISEVIDCVEFVGERRAWINESIGLLLQFNSLFIIT